MKLMNRCEMAECRTQRQKVLVSCEKNVRCFCVNEKTSSVFNQGSDGRLQQWYQILSSRVIYFLPFAFGLAMWLDLARRILAKLTQAESWKLGPVGKAFSVVFGNLWWMPCDEAQVSLVNARWMSKDILNLKPPANLPMESRWRR